MANNMQSLCVFKLRDMLPTGYGLAMPIDSWDIIRHGLTVGFIVMAHGISVPISWESPPILPRRNR